jgi:5-bromo-4-chloroindolyl phosphate hydrolysis protein
MLERKKGLPVIAVVACTLTAICFSRWWFLCIIFAAASFFVVLLIFPAPVYFEEVKKSPIIDKPLVTGNLDLDSVMTSIYENKKEIVKLSSMITSTKITTPLKELLRVIEQIIDYTAENPDKIKMLRQFCNYYLPATVNFLQTYEDLEKRQIKGENINSTLRKIEEVIVELVDVYKNEYDDLFSDKIMDVTAEAAVIKSISK